MLEAKDRIERVEAARKWFDKNNGSLGSLTWEDVELVAQLGVTDAGAARNLLLTAPDSLFSSWAKLQKGIAVGGDAAHGARRANNAPRTATPSVNDRLKTLTEWHASASASGRDHDLSGLGAEDLERIARSGAMTVAKIRELSTLSALQVVRAHAEEIAMVLSGKPAESEIYKRIKLPSGDSSTMPPSGPLPSAEIALIESWIAHDRDDDVRLRSAQSAS